MTSLIVGFDEDIPNLSNDYLQDDSLASITPYV
jgi:hypothetical protein